MTTANPFAAKRSSTPPKDEPALDVVGKDEPKPNTTPPATAKSGDPFDMPTGPGSGEKITDFVGELLLVKPDEYLLNLNTSIGVSDAIRADVAVLSGERQGDLLDGILIFQTALRRELKKTLEGPNDFKIGRLGLGEKKPGKSAPYIFETPSDDDITLARQYLAAHA